MSAPQKLTDQGFTRLEEVAALKVRIPGYKQLVTETGLSEPYIKNIMSRLVRLKRANVNVSRETIRKSLMNEAEFKTLIEQPIAEQTAGSE